MFKDHFQKIIFFQGLEFRVCFDFLNLDDGDLQLLVNMFIM